MSKYLYVEVSRSGPTLPFWIKQDDVVLAQTQLCRSEAEVAHVLRNYLRGLWRKGYINGNEKLVFNNPAVSEAWDLNRFRDKYQRWVDEVLHGRVCFDQ
jgi:hypothetical protein